MDAKCRRCRETFTNEEKLAKHLKTHHHGKPNRDPRIVRLAVGAAALLVIGLLIWQSNQEEPVIEGGQDNRASFGVADDPYLGDPEAPVVVVGFEAPRCSACLGFHFHVLPDLKAKYFDTGKAVFHYAQFTPGYDFDRPGGIAQECVYREGGNEAFWPFTDLLYERQGQIHEGNLDATVRQFASAHGLDADVLSRCVAGKETEALLDDDWSIARQKGARGTPAFFVFGAEGEAVSVTTGQLDAVLAEMT